MTDAPVIVQSADTEAGTVPRKPRVRRRRPVVRGRQRRDEAGKFAGRKSRRSSQKLRSRAGRSGASRHAILDKAALVRSLVRIEHKVGRLEAEAKGVPWVDPESVTRANMAGIRRGQNAMVESRMAAVDRTRLFFAGKRRDAGHLEFAEKVAEFLTKPFSWRNLYNKPYATMWRQAAPARAPDAIDMSPRVAKHARLTRRMVIHKIQGFEKRLELLIAGRRVALVAQSEEEGWTPLSDHHSVQNEGATEIVATPPSPGREMAKGARR